ncbi:MAG: glycosyltransferase family 2 protein [Ruminiclostridium sp.]
MILTIGMIVKNEEKYLEQCLTAIKPILEQVDSELIIADTGSTDRTVEIARRFTDNVFFFEWIKDFAAARNSTLQKAKGEWFMYLDADEIFESCDEIISFFNSGEYKKYNSASYIQRNYSDIQGGDGYYSDFRAPRLTKILPRTRFIKPVHEFLNTYGEPLRVFNDYVHHYGYVFNEDNPELTKLNRNYELLLKRYETEKDSDATIYLQLFECLYGMEREKAMKYLEDGIELCKRTKDITLAALYRKKAHCLYTDKEYESVLGACRDYFNMDKKIKKGVLGSDVEITALAALSLFRLGRYEEAIQAYTRFFALYKDYKNGKLNTPDVFLTALQVISDGNFLVFIIDFVQSCISGNKYETAAEYIKTLPVEEYCTEKKQIGELVFLTIRVAEHFGYSDIYNYYRKFDDYGKGCFQGQLISRLFRKENKEKTGEILAALGGIAAYSRSLTAALPIYKEFFENRRASLDSLKAFSEEYGLENFPEMLYIAAACGLDLVPLMRLENTDIKSCISICYNTVSDFHSALSAYKAEYIGELFELPEAAAFMLYAMKAAIVIKEKGADIGIDGLFALYADIGRSFCEKSGNFSEELLPADILPAFIAKTIAEKRKSRDFHGCFTEMKRLVTLCPETAAVIGEYQKGAAAEYERVRPKTEFEKLADTIKNNIRGYISAGNMQAALHTLNEYKKINPSDPEIPEISKLIR